VERHKIQDRKKDTKEIQLLLNNYLQKISYNDNLPKLCINYCAQTCHCELQLPKAYIDESYVHKNETPHMI